MEFTSNERGLHLHTFEDRDAEALQERGWRSVHAVIQIAVDSDLSVEQRCLRVQHTCSPVMSPVP